MFVFRIWALSLEKDAEEEAEFRAKMKEQANAPEDLPPQLLFVHQVLDQISPEDSALNFRFGTACRTMEFSSARPSRLGKRGRGKKPVIVVQPDSDFST